MRRRILSPNNKALYAVQREQRITGKVYDFMAFLREHPPYTEPKQLQTPELSQALRAYLKKLDWWLLDTLYHVDYRDVALSLIGVFSTLKPYEPDAGTNYNRYTPDTPNVWAYVNTVQENTALRVVNTGKLYKP